MRNQVVSHEEWLKARLELLAAEKEFSRQRDALTRRRMAMPWERVERPYRSCPWVSSCGSDFNFDYYVSFTPEQMAEGKAYYNYEARPIDVSDEQGISVCYKNDRGEVFHTYSCHGRGIGMVNGAYQFLDLVPKGRDERLQILHGVGTPAQSVLKH
jgi:predicted dithiol-disulfide oxidoreductase (DUF899 family)